MKPDPVERLHIRRLETDSRRVRRGCCARRAGGRGGEKLGRRCRCAGSCLRREGGKPGFGERRFLHALLGEVFFIMATVYRRGGQRNRGGRYYISYFDHTGQRITRSARTNDKSTAERIAAKLESDAALRRDKVIDPTVDNIQRESQRTIESHLADYEAKIREIGRAHV